jgi:translocator protein
MQMNTLVKLALCILICLGVGMIGGAFTQTSVETWYPALAKPAGNPPATAFAPVWVFLYVMMGVSLWWAVQSKASKQALALFTIQLLLNLFWSFLVFGMQSLLLGVIDILLLDAAVIATVVAFWSCSKPAALLLVPYLMWILYATYLNIGLFILNRAS